MLKRTLLIAATVGATAATAPGQELERFVYTTTAAGDTIAVERVGRSVDRLEGELSLLPQRLRITYDAVLLPDARVASIETRLFRMDGDGQVQQQVRITFRGDSAIVLTSGQEQRVPTRAGAVPYLNLSTALLEQTVMHARRRGENRVELPAFLLAGAQTLPMSITFAEGSAQIEFSGVVFDLRVTPDGRLESASVPAQQIRITREAGDREVHVAPPDYSAPADAPYAAEDVVLHTPAGLRLAGTLTLPTRRPRAGAPAIVTITGSGPQNRDSEIPMVRGYRPFRQIADSLGRRGIAVLRLDDRGVGGSDAGPAGATSADLADDIRAAIGWLRAHPEIDGSRIGLVGHSEGGLIAPMIAATDPRLRGIVLMAGTASTGREILGYQQRYVVDSIARLTGSARDSALAAFRQSTDSAAAVSAWLGFFLEHDPVATARRVRTPVLILQGSTDHQVPEAEAHGLGTAFRAGGNRDVTVRVYPELNHLFLHDPSGSFAGYGQLESPRVPDRVIGDIAEWLVRRLGRAR